MKTITYDLYKELGLDRSLSEAEIKKKLKETDRMWRKRQSACNDKEQLLIIDALMSKIEEGFRYLIKADQRKEYDEALDKAYKAGKIEDKTEEKMKGLLEQAMEYYEKGNLKMAAQTAQEAVDGRVNDPRAYDLLARCYFDLHDYPKALAAADAGTEVFKNDYHLYWLGARIAATGTENFEDAQNRVNHLLEMAPDNPLGHSEEIFLHLCRGDEELAFKEIDGYIEKHPDDTEFKRLTAYNIDLYADGKCFYYDKDTNSTFIAERESYEECLRLCTKAQEIYNDEHTVNRLKNAQYYGQKECDGWNLKSIKSLTFYGVILTIFLFPVGVILLGIDAALIYYSFRPYWQINRTYVTGQRGGAEQTITIIGEYAAKIGGKLVDLIGWILKTIIMLILQMWGYIFRQ